MQHVPPQKLTLADVLAGKDKKAQAQQELRDLYGTPVVGIGVNMPGNSRYNYKTVQLLQHAVALMRQYLQDAGAVILEERFYHWATGPIAILAVEGQAELFKRLAVTIEESADYGRLLDIDVFDEAGLQIDRSTLGLAMRHCLICESKAVDCMRSHTHTPDDVIAAAQKLLIGFQADSALQIPQVVEKIGTTALTAMLMEAACTPAPGLVDRDNSGAHHDMDFFTFQQSSAALAPAMFRCAMAGWEHQGKPEDLLPILRRIGEQAEKNMFAVTQGVNTQKGLLFLLGILAAATARILKVTRQKPLAESIVEEAARISSGLVSRELANLKLTKDRKLTAGERLFLAHGATGIRGEIEAGLPTVIFKGLPCFRESINAGLSLNDALVHALIGIMSQTQDTTILHRHGPDTLDAVKQDSAAILDAGGMMSEKGRRMVFELDGHYSSIGISPGGSADLIAATYFLHRIDELFN